MNLRPVVFELAPFVAVLAVVVQTVAAFGVLFVAAYGVLFVAAALDVSGVIVGDFAAFVDVCAGVFVIAAVWAVPELGVYAFDVVAIVVHKFVVSSVVPKVVAIVVVAIVVDYNVILRSLHLWDEHNLGEDTLNTLIH